MNAKTCDTKFPHRSHQYLLTLCARKHKYTPGIHKNLPPLVSSASHTYHMSIRHRSN